MVTPSLDFSIGRVECSVTGQIRVKQVESMCKAAKFVCCMHVWKKQSHSCFEPCVCVTSGLKAALKKYAPVHL